MFHARHTNGTSLVVAIVAVCLAGTGWSLGSMGALTVAPAPAAMAVQATAGSPGVFADTCGVPAEGVQSGGRGAPVFPPGQYPVTLPDVSFLGARNDLPNVYLPGVHWGQLPDDRRWGSLNGIAVAPDGTIWGFERCGVFGFGGTPCLDVPVDPILQFDASGTFLQSFGQGMIVTPHKLTVDSDGNVWVTDIGTAPGKGQQVLKFSPDGELLMALGKAGISGSGPDEFDQPTDVEIGPNGDIFVADGHRGGGGAVGNSRIVKFDANGNFIKTWGKRGMGPGEFDIPHALAFDSQGRLFVADRQNNRVQVFDSDGNVVDVWYHFGRPSALDIDDNDVIYVADSESRDGRTNTGLPAVPPSGYGFNPGTRRGIRIGSARDGSVTSFIPDPCPYPYPDVSSMTEGIAVDAEGTIYGVEYLGTVRKYVKRSAQ
jgi:hypothetical protein